MRRFYSVICLLVIMSSACADGIMTRDGNTYIVNTTELCSAKGFKSTTPLLVYIENGCVVNIEALSNEESKGYFERIKKQLFPKYSGKKISAARKLAKTAADEIDGVSGATYSATAVQQNIAAALEYYAKNKGRK